MGAQLQWPTLDVKLVNNTGQTVVFHEAVFCVRESRLDARPVPVIKGIAYGMYLPLYNVGWGPMIDCKIRFKLTPDDQGATTTPQFVWQVGNVDEVRVAGSLTPFFTDSGVDTNMLKRLQYTGYDRNWFYVSPESGLGEPVPDDARFTAGSHRMSISEYSTRRRRALGPFVDGFAIVRGTLPYTQNDIDGSQSHHANPFRAIVSFRGTPRGRSCAS